MQTPPQIFQSIHSNKLIINYLDGISSFLFFDGIGIASISPELRIGDSRNCAFLSRGDECLEKSRMTQESDMAGLLKNTSMPAPLLAQMKPEAGERNLLLQAFEIFTQASNSLETAYSQLQVRVQRLTEELEAKNIELEKSLREKEEAQSYLRNILERLPCGVFVIDARGNLSLCNPMASEVFEQSNCLLPGNQKHPFLSSELRNHLTSAGAPSGCDAEVELPVLNSDRKRILTTSWAPLADFAGDPIGTLHIIRDVTEVKLLQEQSKRIERLSAMGEMAAELAHEIRNPLGSIELFSSLLAKDLTGDLKRWAESIRVGIRSLNTIVSNMLHFANPISPAFASVNVHGIIEEILRFTDPIMNQREVHVAARLKARNPEINGDPELLKQMMLNLIFNAMKAMPARGSLTIKTRTIRQARGTQREPCLELKIQDTGIGIPPENLKRIFDPFFTTNKNGTGLGLSVVHQIVETHSGTIRVSSKVNQGTTFTMIFGCRPGKE
jgi:PAS domain S-box-containing protein